MANKFDFDSIMIEITRECNLKCDHCFRGDAQNLTITPEIIDKLLADIRSCNNIVCTGGEPMLHIEMIGYLVHKIMDSNTSYLEMTTNGTVLDEEIVRLFGDFCASREDRTAVIRISNDHFHDQLKSEQAFSFYEEAAKREGYPDRLKIRYQLEDRNTLSELRLAGRSKDRQISFYTDSRIEYINVEPLENHRIKIKNGKVACQLYLCANGNLGFVEEQSFDTIDRLTFGNILDNSVSDLIAKNNENCLLTCRESFIFDRTKMLMLFINTPEFDKYWSKTYHDSYTSFIAYVSTYFSDFILRRINNLRKQARQTFPHLSSQKIIESIPFPYDPIFYLLENINTILTFSQTVTDEMLNDIDNRTLEKHRAAVEEAKRQCKDDSETLLYTLTVLKSFLKIYVLINLPEPQIDQDEIWAFTRIEDAPIYKHLKYFNDSVGMGLEESDNSKILPCYANPEQDNAELKNLLKKEFRKECGRIYRNNFGKNHVLDEAIKPYKETFYNFLEKLVF